MQSVLQQVRSFFSSRKVRYSSYSIKFQYLPFCLILSSSHLRILPRLPSSSIFLPIPCFKRKFLSKMRPIQLAFLGFTLPKTFLSSLTPCNTSSKIGQTDLLYSPSAPHFRTSKVYLITFLSVHVSTSYNSKLHTQHFNTGNRRYLNSTSGVLCEALYGARGCPLPSVGAQIPEQPFISIWKSFNKICWESSELTDINVQLFKAINELLMCIISS